MSSGINKNRFVIR